MSEKKVVPFILLIPMCLSVPHQSCIQDTFVGTTSKIFITYSYALQMKVNCCKVISNINSFTQSL